ncbi:DUF721 domain-containing protein [Paracoccus zhouxuedongae]|uniref:DUF721 domain-containing protein n=1 Tax=Paracoccus sp. p4-l81 TaxID=3342806 RepID=UPI0035BC55C5
MAPNHSDRPKRRMRGFEPAAGLLRARIRAAGEARGFAVARLLTEWEAVVGPDLAAICRPVKVGYARTKGAEAALGATLTLLTSGAAAPVVQMRLPQIRDRVNACYGYNAIARISVTQTAAAMAAPGLAEAQAAYAPPPAAPDPRLAEQAAGLTEGITDPTLRAALAGLAQLVLISHHPMKG